MRLFLTAEFILGFLIGFALSATNTERQVLRPGRLVRALSPDDAITAG